MLRFIVWMLSNVLYRVKTSGMHNIPREGAAVLVCNHVSLVDWLILVGAVKRPARYIMDQAYFDMPIVNWLFRAGKAIPILSKKVDSESPQRALEQVSKELQEGWLVCIFPEGQITRTGEFNEFRTGIERIVERDPVPVIPIALNGLWGSYFSRVEGKAMSKPFRRWWSQVWVTVEAPVPPEEVTAKGLQDKVHEIWARMPDHP
jgi:1-acyl-sn-glycerol-3-phosphate acyltransferase